MEITEIPINCRMGEKVILTRACVSKFDEMFHLIQSFDDRHNFLNFWPWNKNAEAVAQFLLQAASDFDNDVRYVFLVVERGSGLIVGIVGVERTAAIIPAFHIGYWIGTDHMGQGYATEATILARDFVLRHLKPVRLQIMPAQSNEPSIRVAIKAGFTVKEAILKNAIHGRDRKPDNQVMLTYPLEDERPA